MANKKNLKPFTSEQSHEEAVKNGRKGGIESGKSRRRTKEMRERLDILLSMPLTGGESVEIEQMKNFKGVEKKNVTVEDAILIATIKKALLGDVQAIAFLRDTLGEKPKETIAHSHGVVFVSGEEDIFD
jgi:hypothetical protein